MILPHELQSKINELYSSVNKKILTETQKNLTAKYKEQTGQSKSLIDDSKDSVLYAVSRMPATYSVIYTLVDNLVKQGLIQNVGSAIDFGAGTGAGYFALKELDEEMNFTLIERDKNMIGVFEALTDKKIDVVRGDIEALDKVSNADLVLTSYVLSEMTENDRINAVKKLLCKTNKCLLIIDTGTPRTYENMMKIKKLVNEMGWHVSAPCMTKKCGLVNDYCQFYARVERSALHKLAKNGTLPYEDEKYFYLLIQKEDVKKQGSRVIRRPVIKENNVELVLCSIDGVKKSNFTKKNKDEFKVAKKSKINDLI